METCKHSQLRLMGPPFEFNELTRVEAKAGLHDRVQILVREKKTHTFHLNIQ